MKAATLSLLALSMLTRPFRKHLLPWLPHPLVHQGIGSAQKITLQPRCDLR
jgi:hypothetical protein